ncbi:MAG: hypothetical protein ACK5EA_26110 [Planctomycetaceae bacterium]
MRMFGENADFFQDGMKAHGTGKDLHDDRFEPVCSAEGRNSQWLKNDAEALATKWVLRVLWETQDAESMLGGVLAGIQVAGPKAQEVRDALVEILNKRLEVGVANVQMRQPPYAFLPPAAMRKPGSEDPAFVYSDFVSFATVDNGSGWVDCLTADVGHGRSATSRAGAGGRSTAEQDRPQSVLLLQQLRSGGGPEF